MAFQVKEPDTCSATSLMNFRRFERDIMTVLKAFPRIVEFRPNMLKPSSYAKLFREACSAYCHSDCTWESPIDRNALYTIWTQGNLRIRFDDGKKIVTVGPLEFHEVEQASIEKTIDVITMATAVDVSNDRILHALLLLKNHDIIKGEVLLKHLSENRFVPLMDEYPNITLVALGNGAAKLF